MVACLRVSAPQSLLAPRLLLALHSSGHALPVAMSVTLYEDDFVCTVQPLQSKFMYLLFRSKSLVITAATEAALRTMDVRFVAIVFGSRVDVLLPSASPECS